MKAAPKTKKPKRQETGQLLLAGVLPLLCGCILIALCFLLSRVAATE